MAGRVALHRDGRRPAPTGPGATARRPAAGLSCLGAARERWWPDRVGRLRPRDGV